MTLNCLFFSESHFIFNCVIFVLTPVWPLWYVSYLFVPFLYVPFLHVPFWVVYFFQICLHVGMCQWEGDSLCL